MKKEYNDNFYSIWGFMVADLELKGLELQLYALIYQFSHHKCAHLVCDYEYMECMTGAAEEEIKNTLEKLVSKGLVICLGQAKDTVEYSIV